MNVNKHRTSSGGLLTIILGLVIVFSALFAGISSVYQYPGAREWKELAITVIVASMLILAVTRLRARND